MAILPEAIHCTLTQDGLPLAGVLVRAIFKTNFKNDYSFIFAPTDSEGKTSLLKSGTISQALQQLNLALMDFGLLEQCFTGVIDLKVMTDNDIKQAINAYNIFKPALKFPTGYYEMLQYGLKRTQELKMNSLSFEAQVISDNEKTWVHIQHRYGCNYLKISLSSLPQNEHGA
jgi:hypothetical protein